MAYRDSFHIDAPVPTVFDFFRDPDNFSHAEPGQIEFKDVVLTEEGVGTHYTWATKIAGIPFEGFDVYTECIPNERITDRSSSALEGTWTYTFAPDGSGTRLTVENRVRSIWGLPPLRQLLDLVTAKTHRPRFERLTTALEQ
jgi:ligand-binding SRPBCC domain-containing protein